MGFQDRHYNQDPGGGWGGSGGFGGGMGGGMGGGGFRIMTPGRHSYTFYLLVANVVIFFIGAFMGRVEYGANPIAHTLLERWGAFTMTDGVYHLQVWRLVTYQFLHGDGNHLFFNMLGLFFFGPMVEGFLGSKRYLGLYLLCGVAGAVMYILLFALGKVAGTNMPFAIVSSPDSMMVGASGAIFGVLMAAYRIAPHSNVLLMFVIPVPFRVLIVLIVLIQVYVVMVGADNAGGSAAHLGGLVLGWLLMSNPQWLNFVDRVRMDRVKPSALKAKAKQSAWEKKLKAREEMEREVDRILEKVNVKGLHSLSAKEKKVLQQATESKRRSG
ncbi:MAG: rhomboid family intramembrane serine protease [Planctomycetota bacterium]|jgi:membrane associated rhomboid family serine protease